MVRIRGLFWLGLLALPPAAPGESDIEALTLPRQLLFSRDGQLRQIPAPKLNKLRGKPVAWRNVRLENERKALSLPESNTLEIETEIDLQPAAGIGLGIKSGNKAPQLLVNFNGLELQVPDAKAPLTLAKGDRKLKLRIFIDRSVLEVFANETVCVTKTISPLEANGALEIRAAGGNANAKRIQAWPIRTIW